MSLNLIRRNPSVHTADAARPHEVSVRVRGGYQPDTIRAEAGVPLRIVFRREESSPCSEQVVFPALGKSATLPQGEKIAVDLFPEEPGEYEFTCAMGMLRGTLVVTPPGVALRSLCQRWLVPSPPLAIDDKPRRRSAAKSGGSMPAG